MKAIEIKNSFGIDSWKLADRPSPDPDAGQVLIKMRSASLNYPDLLVVQGRYNPKQGLRLIPLSDGVGK